MIEFRELAIFVAFLEKTVNYSWRNMRGTVIQPFAGIVDSTRFDGIAFLTVS